MNIDKILRMVRLALRSGVHSIEFHDLDYGTRRDILDRLGELGFNISAWDSKAESTVTYSSGKVVGMNFVNLHHRSGTGIVMGVTLVGPPRPVRDLTAYQKRALPVLDQSIAHWKRMAANEQEEGECPSAEYCACCGAFNPELGQDDCEEQGCPIALAVGDSICHRTPYARAYAAFKERGRGDPFDQTALDEQVAFLEQVRADVASGKVKP